MVDPVSPEKELKFLMEHRDADVIVVDAETKRPVAAEYLTCKGIPRTFPVRYWINGDTENLDLSRLNALVRETE